MFFIAIIAVTPKVNLYNLMIHTHTHTKLGQEWYCPDLKAIWACLVDYYGWCRPESCSFDKPKFLL